MRLKSIAAAVGFAALTAFATAPARPVPMLQTTRSQRPQRLTRPLRSI